MNALGRTMGGSGGPDWPARARTAPRSPRTGSGPRHRGATAFGRDAYDSLEEKAPALLHSSARTDALVDGNTRLALAATIAFLGLNGYRLTLTNDEAHTLVIEVASGLLDNVADIADRIRAGIAPRRP